MSSRARSRTAGLLLTLTTLTAFVAGCAGAGARVEGEPSTTSSPTLDPGRLDAGIDDSSGQASVMGGPDIAPPRHPQSTPAPSEEGPSSDGIAPATPAPAAPAPTPAPQATAGRAFFMAPGGNDAAAGTLEAPWRTVASASQHLRPGDTLWVRGGTYIGQYGYNWAESASGTAAAPIRIAAYNGEQPVFEGEWTYGNGLILYRVGYVIVDGLTFTHYNDQWGAGALLLLEAHHITVQNSRFIDNGETAQNDHHIYLNSGCSDIVIQGNEMRGTPGGAVHLYHEPGPTNVVIRYNTMTDGFWGVVVGSTAHTVTITNNTFARNVMNIELTTNSSNVTASGNSPDDVIH